MEGAVYLMCAATAFASAALLLRGYRRTRARLLAWCALFFLALCLENVLLFVDRVVFTGTDLSAVCNVVGLVGGLCLVFGLVWASE